MEPVFTETILGKHKVTYYYCKESGLLKTESPYWLHEAYQDAIADTDTGLVSRNFGNRKMLDVILHCLAIDNGTFLDVAGGYGLLTRLMRDNGFDCYTTDKYCQNLFAKTFEPGTHFRADALFAFEVLEHIEDPLQFLSAAFDKYCCRTILLSTSTFSDSIPPKDWCYYSFETGQHITFYQPRTLALLADRLGCKHYMIDTGFHIITDREIPRWRCAVLLNNRLRKLYSRHVVRRRKMPSKTWDDHLKMKELLTTR